MKNILFFSFLVISFSVFSKNYYVDSSAGGTNDGSSWVNAYDSLYKAFDKAVSGDTVLVAEGTYKVSQNADRTACFRMPSGVVLMGGYLSGGGGRDIWGHPTILSGDIGVQGDLTDNTYHVLYLYQTSPATVIDGIFITGGYADGSGDDGSGGGIYVQTHSSRYYGVTIIRCRIYDNYAITGGGVNIDQKGEIYYSKIENNRAASYGGGLSIHDDGRAYNTVIRNNYAGTGGGGVSIGGFNSAPGLFNCIISNNETAGEGSGIYQGESRVFNCDIVNNKGGHAVKQNTYARISNSIIWGNTPNQFAKGNYATITNCAIADPTIDDPGIIVLDSMNSGLNDTVAYVRFSYPADSVGNVSTPEGWTHLKQAYWYIMPGSACINKGDNDQLPDEAKNIDYYGHSRIIDDTIDVGFAEAIINLSTDSAVVKADKVVFYGNVLFSTDQDLTRRGFDWGTDPQDLTNHMEHATQGQYAYSDSTVTLPAPGMYYCRTWGMVGANVYPGPVRQFLVCSTDTTREVADVCGGDTYVFPDGTVVEGVDASMVHYSHLTGIFGCDSVVETSLQVTVVNTSVTQEGNMLTAGAAGAVYQWLDCDNGHVPIAGATEQSYTPSANGSYAVAVTQGDCTDTSACYAVTTVGVNRHPKEEYEVYPNPVGDQLIFETGGEDFSGQLALWNVLGEKIREITVKDVQRLVIPVAGLRQGVYFLKVTDGEKSAVYRILKK